MKRQLVSKPTATMVRPHQQCEAQPRTGVRLIWWHFLEAMQVELRLALVSLRTFEVSAPRLLCVCVCADAPGDLRTAEGNEASS